MELTLVTTNEGKLAEVREICRPYGVSVRWAARRLSEPQAESLEEVVRAKVAQTRSLRGAVLVEDSGLFVPALNGFPGVYSAHVFDIWGWGPILELLRRRPRAAEYRCVAALRIGRRLLVGTGRSRGRLASAPRGDGGFGFDPIFVPAGSSRTYAELSAVEKNRRSHRGRAVRAVLRQLPMRRVG